MGTSPYAGGKVEKDFICELCGEIFPIEKQDLGGFCKECVVKFDVEKDFERWSKEGEKDIVW